MPHNERVQLPQRQPRRETSLPDAHIIDRIRRERQQEDQRPHAPSPEPPGQRYEDPGDEQRRKERENPEEKDRGVIIIDM